MALGWRRLRSGGLFFGTLPPGVESLPAPEPAPTDGGDPPAKSASKAAWVDYATSLGWTPEDAERKTKRELVDELGQQDVDPGESAGPVGTEVPGGQLGTDPLEGGAVEGPASEDGPGLVGHGDEG